MAPAPSASEDRRASALPRLPRLRVHAGGDRAEFARDPPPAHQGTPKREVDLPILPQRAAIYARAGLPELLEKVVTIRPPSGVNIAIALDYYKDPDSDPDPMQWKNTKAGELVSRAKYKKAPGALDDLTRELVSVVRRHPLLSGCDAVLSIPGHDALNESFSGQLARAVAADLGIPFERTGARRVTRPEAKAIGESDDLSNEFTVNSVVRGRPVLIVDDVLMSGRTMAAVANAARRAGAVAVCGLVGAKTLKKQARNDA